MTEFMLISVRTGPRMRLQVLHRHRMRSMVKATYVSVCVCVCTLFLELHASLLHCELLSSFLQVDCLPRARVCS